MGTPAGVPSGRLLLCRNTGRSRGVSADDDPRLLECFAHVAINNGLECKVACSNSKVGIARDCPVAGMTRHIGCLTPWQHGLGCQWRIQALGRHLRRLGETFMEDVSRCGL